MNKTREEIHQLLDWSTHELIIREYKSSDNKTIYEHTLQIPNSNFHRITFINTDECMMVYGDYYNWIFCRPFIPKAGDTVSDMYWIEKLKIYSIQKFELDVEACKKEYIIRKNEILNEHPSYFDPESDDYKPNMVEFYEEIEGCNEEFEYYRIVNEDNYSKYAAICEDCIPYHFKKIPNALYCVFEAWEEICRRLKTKKK